MNKPEAVTPTGASTPCSKEEDRDLLFMLSDDLMSEEELTGRPSIDFVVPEDRELTLNARNEVKQGQHVTHLENRYRCKDGSFRWLSWRSHPMVDVKKVFCVARDITEYKKIEHCLQHVQRLESIGTLADGIAHNLNNILAPAMLSVDFLYIQETDAEKREQLKTILDSLQRGASMVQHVMSFSRGVHGTIQHIHIPRLLEDVLTIPEKEYRKMCRIAFSNPSTPRRKSAKALDSDFPPPTPLPRVMEDISASIANQAKGPSLTSSCLPSLNRRQLNRKQS
jgi:signal transduction histidine kinase